MKRSPHMPISGKVYFLALSAARPHVVRGREQGIYSYAGEYATPGYLKFSSTRHRNYPSIYNERTWGALMSTADLTLDLLTYRAFPLLASALTVRKDAILQEWESAVAHTLPAADALTLKSLRDSMPLILQEIIEAFASDQPVATRDLVEGSKLHGESRFQENYNM